MKLGKQTKINLEANKLIKQELLSRDITTCELRLGKCMRGFGLSIHHRHKRLWYYSKPELLSEFNQCVLACASCHDKVEYNRPLHDKIFTRLRGEEGL